MFQVIENRMFGENTCESVYDFSGPLECTLPGYHGKYRVWGIARRANHGRRILTLAAGEWTRDGFATWHRISDPATQMRLADLISDHHQQPINADRLYGPLGRNCGIGRIVDSRETFGGTVDRISI